MSPAMIQSTFGSWVHLFFDSKFQLHRVFGLCCLIQFTTLAILLFSAALGYQKPQLIALRRALTWTTPLSGFVQACAYIAAHTFYFLPRTGGEAQGYYSDKRTMSYDWIQESLFFSLLLCYASFYYLLLFS